MPKKLIPTFKRKMYGKTQTVKEHYRVAKGPYSKNKPSFKVGIIIKIKELPIDKGFALANYLHKNNIKFSI